MDLRRIRQHAEWLAYWRSADHSGPEPPPGFKDCGNCTLRKRCEDEPERRALCAQCPYDDPDLPDSLGRRYLLAQALNSYPTEAVATIVGRLSVRELRDLQAVRAFLADEKEARTMQALGLWRNVGSL